MAFQPSARSVLGRAAALIASREAASAGPAVFWSGLGESPEAFDRRLGPILGGGRLVLTVVPHAFPVPTGARPVELPAKLHALLHPDRKARYRVAYGGRASAKSWSIARALVVQAVAQPMRVLCAREFQNSIAESVHKLLVSQIEQLGLMPWFTITRDSVASTAGAEFAFVGLRLNASKVRSMEGFTHCWCEEAAYISADSWGTLIPTIRAPGSEFLISFNPDREADATYQRFVASSPPKSVIEFVNADDNPWLGPEMRAERAYLQSVDADAARWVWGGYPRQYSAAQVFCGKLSVEPVAPGPEWAGPFYGCDLGFARDPTVLIRCWVHDRCLYIDAEAWAIGCDIDATPQLFDTVPGARDHVIRTDSARPETVSYLQRHAYPGVQGVTKWAGSVQDGLAHLRQYERIVIDPKCVHAIEELHLYSFKVDRLSGDIKPEPEARNDHVADAVRYALQPCISQQGAGIFDFYDRLAAKAEAAAAPPETPTDPPWRREDAQARDLAPGLQLGSSAGLLR